MWVICLPSQCSAHPHQHKVILPCCESLPPYLTQRSLFNLRAEREGRMLHPSTTTTTTTTHGDGAVGGHTTEGDTTTINTQTTMEIVFMHLQRMLAISIEEEGAPSVHCLQGSTEAEGVLQDGEDQDISTAVATHLPTSIINVTISMKDNP